MNEQLNLINTWIHAHPWATVAIVVYIILNVVPRPNPDELTGLGKVFWLIVDRLAILTRDKLPGRLKMVLLDSPQPADPSESPPPDSDPEPVVDEETPDTDPPAEDSETTAEPESDEPGDEETKDSESKSKGESDDE